MERSSFQLLFLRSWKGKDGFPKSFLKPTRAHLQYKPESPEVPFEIYINA